MITFIPKHQVDSERQTSKGAHYITNIYLFFRSNSCL